MKGTSSRPRERPVSYEQVGRRYDRYRRPDPRIAMAIDAALDGAETVIDVGSGTGSYEPRAAMVVAVEPSRTMIRERSPGAAPAVRAIAERLPVPDGAFDAALAVLTVHHWGDHRAGLAELARVADRQVILTSDPEVFARFWLVADYLPEIVTNEAGLAHLAEVVEGLAVTAVLAVPVPHDCTDGFCGAYWRRPDAYLDPGVRSAISAFARCDPARVTEAMDALARDLASGAWMVRHGHLLDRPQLDLGYRLVVAEGPATPEQRSMT